MMDVLVMDALMIGTLLAGFGHQSFGSTRRRTAILWLEMGTA